MIRNQKTKGTFTCRPLFFKRMFVFQSWLDWLDWLDFNLQYIQGLLQRTGATSDAIIKKDSFGTFFKQFSTKKFFFTLVPKESFSPKATFSIKPIFFRSQMKL